MNKTFIPFSLEPKERVWYLIDAQNLTLGRLSTKISYLLQGKDKINYNSFSDIGNFVAITNADKILVSGNKEEKKLYYKHSGRPGGMKIENFKSLKLRRPSQILEQSVRKMLPKTALGRKMFTHLKIWTNGNSFQKIKKVKLITI